MRIISDMFNWCREAGWRGMLAELLNLDSYDRQDYWAGYQSGLELEDDAIKRQILILAMDISRHQPAKNRGICYIRGLSDALKRSVIQKSQSSNVAEPKPSQPVRKMQ